MSNKTKSQCKKTVILPFWSRIFYMLILLLVIIVMSMVVFFSWRDFMSLVNLKEKVYFSWRVFFISFGFPISFHLLFSIMYACFSDSPRPYRGRVVNFLAWIFFVALLLSVPVSLYVDNKLKYSGYITCSKKSLIAPNEYVKNSKLCN
ncbi:DUF1240 domain-containing protein [Xenorhabdus sp. DI]|uniref:DUF1240 domain-containing protein n=1 Tax=Xenorhabdus doucetiae TaxID=351671 RepID=UPI0019AFA558|nr:MULTISPECIES: DUF1240 domain-containing protein [unclassified Xenorhabdus]MBD2784579.1 DUF1240 domain-containing protein [Xenorhabdus sp. 3]MBD2788324.1 DUF1240 domain-containing protein [Xenorhabdus sp. DI]MBD2796350.1 DUF1240 domain-containing protein [Xenorhabdus sp. 18]